MASLAFDCETTIWNKGHPFDPRNKMVCYGISDGTTATFQYHYELDFKAYLAQQINSVVELIGHNIKFDLHWCRNLGVPFEHCRIWDTMLAEVILSNQRVPFPSLNDTCASYGLPTKPEKIKEYWEAGISTEFIPVPELQEYQIHDVSYLHQLRELQQALMTPEQVSLCYLMGEDLKCLADMEYNGIKWNFAEAEAKKIALTTEIDQLKQSGMALVPPNARPYFNWNSGDDLSALLYGGTIEYEYSIPENATYKSGPNKGQEYIKNRWYTISVGFPQLFKPLEGTEVAKTKDNPDATTRFYQTDIPTLSQLVARTNVQKTLLATLFRLSEIDKIAGMIDTIQKKMKELNWEDNLIHPQFNQNIAVTGRLSSSAPNMQNTPLEVDQFLVSRYE